MKTKICTICNILKPIEEFCKNKITKDGINYKCKKCVQDYYFIHYREIKKQKKIYCLNNKEKIKEKAKNYYKTYHLLPSTIFSIIKRSSKQRYIELLISKSDFIKWYNKQEKICYYCKRTLEEIQQDIKEREDFRGRLSVDRKDNNKGYILDNIVLACRRCNTIKHNYFTEEDMLKIGETIYLRRKK